MPYEPKITSGKASAYTVPTDAPEADGMIAWDSTTLVLVEMQAGDVKGLGYTYAHPSAATVAQELIDKHCVSADVMRGNDLFGAMRRSQRNYGSEGIAACALSAVDMALWDLRARTLGLPLCSLLGVARYGVPVYGSGGFTSYDDRQLERQLSAWAEQGIPRVKMKIGTAPEDDDRRVGVARAAIGDDLDLFVDANGAYTVKQALAFAEHLAAEYAVTWFEEPVSSDDLAGLKTVRKRGPAGMEIAAGEYGWSSLYLKRMIDAGAVDVIQADATRCGGVTGFMETAAIADATPIPLSAHCGPTIHMHLGCAARALRHLEYFHDHVRIESMLFDGFRTPQQGVMYPDLAVPGLGVAFKHADAERYRV